MLLFCIILISNIYIIIYNHLIKITSPLYEFINNYFSPIIISYKSKHGNLIDFNPFPLYNSKLYKWLEERAYIKLFVATHPINSESV